MTELRAKILKRSSQSLEKEAGRKDRSVVWSSCVREFFKITSPFTVLESGEIFAEQIITVIGGIIEKELEAREKGAAGAGEKIYR
ncbi:MAG: hypothetical protein ACLRIP_12475 [Blautia massiliensis (ex Durand et al. 2017)]